jgi:hypothetical protein
MKKVIAGLILIFITIEIFANKDWIDIKETKESKHSKPNTTLKPIKKMIDKASVIKQLIDSADKKEKPVNDKKKWFDLNG